MRVLAACRALAFPLCMLGALGGCTEDSLGVHLTLITNLEAPELARVTSLRFTYAGEETGSYALDLPPGRLLATERLVARVLPETRALDIGADALDDAGRVLARGDSGPITLRAGTHADATITLEAPDSPDGGVADAAPDLTEPAPDLGATPIHGGWKEIKALGATTPVPQSGLAAAAARVTLAWNPLQLSGETISSYRIFRATTPSGQDYAAPLGTDIALATASYTDTSVVGGTTYYYTIAAVVNGATRPALGSAISEVKVVVPPQNMALVHRWIANAEMCGLMQRPTDPDHDYRCPYTGPGGDGVYFDVKGSLFVDTFEVGCNYTPPPGCGDATNGCLGTAAPASGVGSIGEVWYRRDTGQCYVKTAATIWTDLNSDLAAATRVLATSNSPGLPPLTSIDQVRAGYVCSSVMTSFGAKKLLTHRQQVIAGAPPIGLDDPTIAVTENGTSLNTTGYCNSNSGSGLTYEAAITPTNLETLPGTLASGNRAVRTGGTSTVNCISRHGIRDLVGNVWEWASDQLASCDATAHTCAGGTSTIDPTNTDLAQIKFDGTTSNIGPGGGGANVTEWDFSAQSFSATRFLVPLGLPIVTTAAAALDSLPIGTGAGQFNPVGFHGDRFILTTDNANGTPARGVNGGGSWGDAGRSGRFVVTFFLMPSSTLRSLGLRCAVAAD